MNEIKSYRLGEYRITEYDNVVFSWEKHAALAEQYSGKCFIHGDVLIIGACNHRETGYLIGEFLDQLQKFPEWNRTRYYCSASCLLDVNTGHNLSDDFFTHRLPSANSAFPQSDRTPGPGAFRLGQYQITVDDNHEVHWQTFEGVNKIAVGRCIIESALLFIGPKEYDKYGRSKQDFLDTLTQLPKWDKTVAWSHSDVLLPCRQGQENNNSRFAATPGRKSKESSVELSTAAPGRYPYKETAKILSRCVKWIRTLWQRIRARKVWKKYLTPVLISCLLLAVVITLFARDRILYHWRKEHHHEHHD